MWNNERIRQADAAHRLEELIPAIQETVRLLRQGQSPMKAYALMYNLRWNLGKIVGRLGSGVPATTTRQWAQKVIDEQILDFHQE